MDSTRRRRTSMGNYFPRKFGIYVNVAALAVFISYAPLAYTTFESSSAKHNTLQQVVFLFRHGDRNPALTYPKDPHINYTWPGGFGALTKKGMRRLYDVGQWIRQEYGAFIGDKFESSATTLVRSSYVERCVMSGQALLAGLFPPSPENMFVLGLAWTPVPVFATPLDLDKTIAVAAPCPRLNESLKEAFSRQAERVSDEMIEYCKELSEHTGWNVTTIMHIQAVHNILAIEEQHGLQLPEWTRKFYNDKMRKIAAHSLAIFTDDIVQKRLRGGPLVKEILTHMEEALTNSQTRRSYFYSAHDMNIINTMRTMGLTNGYFLPDYGATLIFELHRANNGTDSEVKVLYLNNLETKTAQPLTIPNCASPCSLQNLKKILHKVIPDDWDAECQI